MISAVATRQVPSPSIEYTLDSFPRGLKPIPFRISSRAILENYQNEDGSVTIPPALVPLCGFDKIEPKAKEA